MEIYGYNEDLPNGKLLVWSFIQPDNRVTIDSIGDNKVHSFMFVTEDWPNIYLIYIEFYVKIIETKQEYFQVMEHHF